MNIKFILIDDLIELDPRFYKNGPDVMVSPEDTNIKWLSELGEIIFLQR